MNITAGQIKKIHTIKSRLGWSDEEYRRFIADWWVNTSKDLSYEGAVEVIRSMEAEAVKCGVRSAGCGVKRYEELAGRPGMASPRQLRMIEAMWAGVSRVRGQGARAAALRHFLKRLIGVEEMRFIEAVQTHMVIEAMKWMRKGRIS